MKVVTTRDRTGTSTAKWIYFWENDGTLSYEKEDYQGTHIQIDADCGVIMLKVPDFKRLFGFTPRCGSKGIYELKLIKAKL